MQNLTKDIIAIAVDQEIDAATSMLSAEQKQAAQQQKEAERQALEAKRAQQQAIFRKEIEPAIELVQALSSNGLTDPDLVIIDDKKTAFRINSGIPLGYIEHITDTSSQEMRSRSRRRGGRKKYNHYRYDRQALEEVVTKLKEEKKLQIRDKAVLKRAFSQEELSENREQSAKSMTATKHIYHEDLSYSSVYADIEDVIDMMENMYDYDMYDDRASARPQHIFYGSTFERGKTTSEDVNEFVTGLVKAVYKRDRNNTENLTKLRNVLQQQFKIDLESVTESARMLAVARNFRACADSDIQMARQTSELDLNALNKTTDDIRAEIATALESQDALAILKIGEDVLDVSRGLISELANDMLPAAIGDDYKLLQSIKRDLTALSPEKGATKKKTIGERLLGNMRRAAATPNNDTNITANFTALTSSLRQRREVVERRVAAVQSKSVAVQNLCDLIDVYKEEIDKVIDGEADPIKSNDLIELKQTFAINAIATKSGRLGIISAVSSEKKAFLALQKTSNAIPLLASSLIQAVNKMRKDQTGTMLAGADQATQVLLEDLSESAKAQALEANLSVSGVFEMADKHIGLIEGHVQTAGQHMQESEKAIQDSAIEAQEHLING